MKQEELNKTLDLHKKWLKGNSNGVKADLYGANLIGADLSGANLIGADLYGADLYGANLREADLSEADLSVANLREADLSGANLIGADLSEADLSGANLREADLSGANLIGADLLCLGNMLEIRTMQIYTWKIGYTSDLLQIGCQKHSIDKWKRWDTEAGRKWIARMDYKALEWAERNLNLVLSIIEANPATPTGHEDHKQ